MHPPKDKAANKEALKETCKKLDHDGQLIQEDKRL